MLSEDLKEIDESSGPEGDRQLELQFLARMANALERIADTGETVLKAMAEAGKQLRR